GAITHRLAIRVPLKPRWDLEDIAISDCDGKDCLYVADIGDNAARRPFVRILRFPEPDPDQVDSVTAEIFPMRYPGGPRDAEAIFVLPGERLFVITKGRSAAVAL